MLPKFEVKVKLPAYVIEKESQLHGAVDVKWVFFMMILLLYWLNILQLPVFYEHMVDKRCIKIHVGQCQKYFFSLTGHVPFQVFTLLVMDDKQIKLTVLRWYHQKFTDNYLKVTKDIIKHVERIILSWPSKTTSWILCGVSSAFLHC